MTFNKTMIAAAALIAGAGTALPVNAEPTALTGRVDIRYPATPRREAFRLTVRPDPSAADYWTSDGHALEVWSDCRLPELLASMPFESSYGHYSLWLSDLTGDGVEEFVLVRGRGRGTSARSETMTVYSRDGAGFTALTEVPFSDFFGCGARWYYQPQFVRDGDRTVIELRLDRDDYSNGRPAFPESIPETELIVIDLR